MDLDQALADLAQIDTAASLPFTALVVAVALWRRHRPLTRARLMEVSLPAILLVTVGLRYCALAAVTLMQPQGVLGEAASPAVAGVMFGLDVMAGLVGLACWRGGVGGKVAAAIVFAAVSVVEALVNAFVLSAPIVVRLDTGLSVVLAALTLVLAAFHWSHHTATPNPLGGKGPPFDY